MKKLTSLLLVLMMLVGVVCMSIGAHAEAINGVEQGNTDCACGGSYGAWTFPLGGACVGGRYYRECDGCDKVQTAKDITSKTLSYTLPAIGANAGDIVMLSVYDVYFTSSKVVSAKDITWSSDDIEIVDNQISTTVAGTYKLTATSGSETKSVYLVVKNPTDTEYVLFFDDFSRDASLEDENGQIAVPSKGNAGENDYEIIQQPSGTSAYFEDGKLVLNTNVSNSAQMRVLLPKWIGDFGDYKIDTNFTIKATYDNNSRWFAVMARVGNSSSYFPIWQAAVRQGAYSYKNNGYRGLEISYTNNGTNWDVPCYTRYTEDISGANDYTLTFDVQGTAATSAMNGTVYLDTRKNNATNKTPTEGVGYVGFHLRSSEVHVYSIKIVVPIDDSIHDFGAWETITPDTCTTDGLERRACSICQTVEERVIKGGHKLVSHAMVIPTCTTSGWSAYEECTVCDYTTFMGEVGALGHYYDRDVRFVTHRGYSSIAPENTLAAYRLAKEKGYVFAECDVAFTKDGVAVLLHDSTIDRTSDGSGNISNLTYEELLQYDFGSWKSSAYAGEKIPTFEEFIALCKEIGIHPYIEIKNSATYTQENIDTLMAIVVEYGMQDNCTWISFTENYLKYVRNADPTARLGFLSSSDLTQSLINKVIALRNGQNEVFLSISSNILTNNPNGDKAMLAASNGVALETWTITSESTLKKLPKYVSGITFESISPEDILCKSVVTAPTCDEQGYTTYTCLCGESVVRDYVPAHDEETVSISYPNGFDKDGIRVVRCLGCDAGESEIKVAPLFTCLGYSVPENGRGGVAVGFALDCVAIEEYEKITGKTIRYGAFVVSKDNIGEGEIFAEDGKTIDGAICAEVTEYGFSTFSIEVIGFTSAQRSLPFAMGAYVAEVGADATEYSYIQREAPSENDIYHFVSYDYIVNFKENEGGEQ